MKRYIFIISSLIILLFLHFKKTNAIFTVKPNCEKQILQILGVDRVKTKNDNLDTRFIHDGQSNTIFPISIAEGNYLSHLYTHRFGGPDKPYMAVHPRHTGIAIQAYNTKSERYFEAAWFDSCGMLVYDSFKQLKNKEKRYSKTVGAQSNE